MTRENKSKSLLTTQQTGRHILLQNTIWKWLHMVAPYLEVHTAPGLLVDYRWTYGTIKVGLAAKFCLSSPLSLSFPSHFCAHTHTLTHSLTHTYHLLIYYYIRSCLANSIILFIATITSWLCSQSCKHLNLPSLRLATLIRFRRWLFHLLCATVDGGNICWRKAYICTHLPNCMSAR